MFHARASVTPKRVLRSLRTQKVLATARRTTRTTPGAPWTARPSKCVISCVTRARSGAPTHTTAETPRARALNMQRRITGSLCTQTVCARNMLHLKTLGRETNLSSTKKSFILSVTRVVSEWRIHPHMHRNTPHAYFGPAQTPPWTPLHSKRAHNIRHLRERAHLLDERATSRPSTSKCIISSAAPVLSSVLMHTPVGTLRTRALAMPKACREPFAVIYGARNGTSHSARNSCLSDPPLAHIQMRLVKHGMAPEWLHKRMNSLRVLWAIPNACRDPFALKRCLQHGTVDSARSSRAHHRPLVDLNARMTSVAPPKLARSCTYPRKRLVCMV